MNVTIIKPSLLFIFLFFISSSSIYSINVCGVNVDENNGFYVLDSSGNYVLAIDRQGDTFIQGSSGVSGGGSGVFEIAGTSFSFSSTDVSYSDSSQSMGSVPNSGFLVESSLGRVSQIDSSGNLRTQGLIAGEGSQGACNSDGWLYCNGGTRENRDYFCNVNGIESGVCTYSVDGSENCLTKSSVDSDGNSFNLGGFVRDFTGCNTGSCTFNDYSDYCSSTNVVVDYRDSGSGVSSSSYNCNSNNYYYCSGLTRRYVDYNCGSGSGGCVENSDLAVETCSAPGPSYGGWGCSDNFTAVRSVTTYSPSCSASGCGISSFTGTDTDSCGGGNICRSGSGCGAPSDCSLEGDGTFVAHGDSITAYDSTSVPYGDSCNSQVRSCYDGVLSGSSVYGYGSCSVGPAPVASCGSRDGNNYDSLSSTSSNLCSSGSVSNFGLSGNVWSWDCNVAGPNDVSCSANENVDGVCENSVLGSCNEGTVSGYSGGSDYTWTCEGINDGSDASCSYSESASCGSRNGNNYDSLSDTSSNLCSDGSVSNFGLSGNVWSWDCDITGPNDVSCSANENVDGVCGSADGSSFTNLESTDSNLCSSGTSGAFQLNGNGYEWECLGINDGSDTSCDAEKLTVEAGSCGSAAGGSHYSLTEYSANLCSGGSVGSFELNGNGYEWDCNGINDPTDDSCSADVKVDGVCGWRDGENYDSLDSDSVGLCDDGAVGGFELNGNGYEWECIGRNGGSDDYCDAGKKVDGVCSSTVGQCTSGNSNGYTGAGDYIWTCLGINDGSDASCDETPTTVDCVGEYSTCTSCQCASPPCIPSGGTGYYNLGVRTCDLTSIITPASGGGTACAPTQQQTCQIWLNSFVAGTQITLFDGTLKNIEEIQVGDMLKGSSGSNEVLELKFHPHEGLVYSINGGDYFVTPGHPFMTNHGWAAFDEVQAMEINPTLEIKKLELGDILVTEEGELELTSFSSIPMSIKVYNFEVSKTKDYYADGYLVHNK